MKSIEKMLEFRLKHLNRALSVSYSSDPLFVTHSKGVYLYDQKGNAFLDCMNNVSHIGHCHPLFIERMHSQLQNLVTNSRILYEPMFTATEKLLALFPPELQTITWTNSGSESNDLAIQMAKIHTKKRLVACIEGAYHGTTAQTMDVSPYKWNDNYEKSKETLVLQTPCTFRGVYNNRENGSELYADDFRQQLKKKKKGLAGFIAESMQSCAGQVIPKKDYFQQIYNVVKENNGIYISDEVQTGFGRIGSEKFAFQHYGLKPDIVTIGKALGNGFPVSAVVCTKEVADSFYSFGIEYFNTFGGNPLALTAAEAVIDIVNQEKLQENAKSVGDYLKQQLETLKEFKQVGDIRGEGLFLGIDIVQQKNGKKPSKILAKSIQMDAKKNGVLISVDGIYGNIIKIKPPIVFSKENADTMICAIRNALKKCEN